MSRWLSPYMYTFLLVSSVPYLLTKLQIIQNAKLYLLYTVNVGFVCFVPLSTSTRKLSSELQTEEVKHYLPLNLRDYTRHLLFLCQCVQMLSLEGIYDYRSKLYRGVGACSSTWARLTFRFWQADLLRTQSELACSLKLHVFQCRDSFVSTT